MPAAAFFVYWPGSDHLLLTEIYANRVERGMFVKGDDHLDLRYAADVIDTGKSANVDRIGLMTPKIVGGQ